MIKGSSGSDKEIENIPIKQNKVYFKIDFDYFKVEEKN